MTEKLVQLINLSIVINQSNRPIYNNIVYIDKVYILIPYFFVGDIYSNTKRKKNRNISNNASRNRDYDNNTI